MVLLNSAEHAISLLDKRSNIYSDRPVLPLASELIGWKYTLVMCPYGERFRVYRKYIAKCIGGTAQMKKYLGKIEDETVRFLRRLVDNPDNLSVHIRK
jgi:hypothetical protein